MKGYYLIGYKELADGKSGISRKIFNQIKAFNSNGLECKEYIQKSGREQLPKVLSKILFYLPFSNLDPKWEYDQTFDDVDFIYFRKPMIMNYAMIRFISTCKKNNPNIKIYIEIPTYPYDGEYKNIFHKYLLFKEKVVRNKLKKVVDCFFVIDPEFKIKTIYDVEAIGFINGYNVKEDSVICRNTEKNVIRIACVGLFNFWHGYERIIEGLSIYKNNGGKNVILDFVGEGSELNYYKKIAKDKNVEEMIKFHGFLSGDELKEFYNTIDVGVSSLGRYKNGINIISDLKTREYLSKGIPVITGCKMDIFEKKPFKYYLEFPNDSTPIDINKVVEFVHNIRLNNNVANEIHNYALNTFDYSITFAPVVNKIKGYE